MSHSQFHSTKVFILRPYDSRIYGTLGGLSPHKVSPPPGSPPTRITAGFLSGRLWLSHRGPTIS